MNEDAPLEFELHGYIDGALDDEAMARIERYLETQPQTAAKVRDYLQQKAEIRGFARTAETEASPGIEALERQLGRRLKRQTLFRWPRVAVVALLLAAGWLGHALYLPLAEDQEFTEGIVQAHILASTMPFDAATVTPERVATLFSRIGERPHVPNLDALGLQPIAAQVFPSDEGLMLHVAYRDASDTVVSLFVLHDEDSAEVRRHVLHRNGVTLVYWQHDHSRYTIAGSVADQELSAIADQLEATEQAVSPQQL